MTAALPDRCARTGGPRTSSVCMARPDGCQYCQLAATRQTRTAPAPVPTRRTRP